MPLLKWAATLNCYVALNLVKRVRRDGNSEAVAETWIHYPQGCRWTSSPAWIKYMNSSKIVRPSLTGSRESPAHTATFKQDSGSHFMLLSLLRFIAACKRRSQNRPYPIGLCLKWCSKELRESPFLSLSLLLKAQCRLNLEKAKNNDLSVMRRRNVMSDKRNHWRT